MIQTKEVTLKKYPAYKDSGVEWLGEIPEGWEVRRMASLGRFSASGIDKLLKKGESSVKIINYTDVYRNLSYKITEDLDLMVVTTPESNRIYNLVEKGDLIYLPSSETFEDLGLCALVDEKLENTSFSYHVLCFKFNIELEHNYKKYFTNNRKVLGEFSKKGTGSIRKTLSRNDFRNTLVILPPLPEQTAIANFLDNKTTKIDTAIAQKERMIALLKERKQIMIQNAVTGKWSMVNGKWSITPKEKLKDSGVEWIGEIPEGWEVLPGFRLFKQNKSKNIGMKEDVVLSLSYGRIIIRPVEKLTGLVPESFETYQIVKPGDIIIRCMDLQNDKTSLRTGIAINHGIITSAYLNLNVINNFDSNYLHHYLHYLDVTKVLYKFGTGLRQNLSYFDFKRLPIIVPPIIVQKKICNYIENLSTKIDQSISLQKTQIEKLKEYKATLIDSAVTGKIKVSEL